jgi:hypothetical protein
VLKSADAPGYFQNEGSTERGGENAAGLSLAARTGFRIQTDSTAITQVMRLGGSVHFMIKPQHILGATLVFCWALLLSVRCFAAMTYAASPIHGNYELGLEEIGYLMPTCAWISLMAGVLIFLGQERVLRFLRWLKGLFY